MGRLRLALGLVTLALAASVALHMVRLGEDAEPAAAAAAQPPAPAAGDAARPPHRPPPKPAAKPAFVDLPKRVQALTRADPARTDYGEHYYKSPAATVHMHVIGHLQSCPLHIHRRSHETTIVVTGRPEVTQVQGVRGAGSRQQQARSPGMLISSPPYCGHRWKNPDRAMQANLVFTAPPFDGNMFLDEDDPRLARAGAPFVLDPDQALQELAAAGTKRELKQLPIMGGKMWLLTFTGEAAAPASPGPTVAYVARGAGTLLVNGEHRFGPRGLTTVPPNTEIKARADAGKPVAMFLFRPEG